MSSYPGDERYAAEASAKTMKAIRAYSKKERTAKNEAELKKDLVIALEAEMPKSLTLRLEDRFRAGTPDIAHTWSRMTSWLEVKYADPDITGRDEQWETCMKLAEQGSCWYVVYYRGFYGREEVLCTYVLSPFSLSFKDWVRRARLTVPGHNHIAVANFIADIHVHMRKIDQ